MRISFSLSDIPGFARIVGIKNCCNEQELTNNTFDKYYSVTNYTTKSDETYKIVKYNKDLLSFDLVSTYGLLRSVIINSQDKVIGFAPPKSVLAEDFVKRFCNITDCIMAQEFVEGTMINVFYDDSLETPCWKIATRN